MTDHNLHAGTGGLPGTGYFEPEEKVFDDTAPADSAAVERLISSLPQAVNDLAVELTEVSTKDGDVYRFVCDRLLKITGARLASISLYYSAHHCMRVKKVSTRGRLLPVANRLLGVTLSRVPFPMTDELHQKFLSLRAEQLDGIHGLMLGALPRKLCKAVDRALGIGHAYAIAYQFNGELLGTSTLWMPRGVPPIPLPHLVTFANFGAAAINCARTRLKLKAHDEQVRSMASEMSLAEERERHNISGALHDQVTQTLCAIQMRLASATGDTMAPDEKNRELQSIVHDVTTLIEQTRTLTFELSPPVLYDMGLEPALEDLALSTAERGAFECRFTGDGSTHDLPRDLAVIVYQAVRELLLNVGKHAQATLVRVQLHRDGDNLVVTVEDNGTGFEPGRLDLRTRDEGGFGLFSIRERAVRLGGNCNIESAPGTGTTITLTLPR